MKKKSILERVAAVPHTVWMIMFIVAPMIFVLPIETSADPVPSTEERLDELSRFVFISKVPTPSFPRKTMFVWNILLVVPPMAPTIEVCISPAVPPPIYTSNEKT